jgi:RimJ/RimL family protein N-acetyltransferase
LSTSGKTAWHALEGAPIVCGVQRQTEEYLHHWWAERFGIQRSVLWRSVSARPHGMLGDYPGFFVAWREAGVHVSLPKGVDPGVERELARRTIEDLQQPAFWSEFATTHGVEVIGPSTHLYLDEDPGASPGVRAPTAAGLASLRQRAGDEDWREAGFDDAPAGRTFGWHDNGELVAASNLNLFGERPRDVGVLVAPEARGRGLAAVVARHAASYAVREHGLARWGARNTNLASLATARRLGFEPFCTQLAMR